MSLYDPFWHYTPPPLHPPLWTQPCFDVLLGLPHLKLPCQESTLARTCKSFWCVNVCVTFGAWGCVSVQFTLAVCRQVCVVSWCVLMSPDCSQCGEEGCAVHGWRAGGQSRQSTGELAGQWRYSRLYNRQFTTFPPSKASFHYTCLDDF